jgi:hypothetical protein
LRISLRTMLAPILPRPIMPICIIISLDFSFGFAAPRACDSGVTVLSAKT